MLLFLQAMSCDVFLCLIQNVNWWFYVGYISKEITRGSLSPSCFWLKSVIFALQVWWNNCTMYSTCSSYIAGV